jgi:membrane-bound lytic murein transglycosylase F
VLILRGLFYFLITLSLVSSDLSERIIATPSILDRIKHNGTLRVLTRIDPTTYYQGPDGPTGLEYDLVILFAEYLGVKTEFITPNNFAEILKLISLGRADIAAAGLTTTHARQLRMLFSPAYHQITEQIIYRSGTRRPRTTDDLAKGILEVVNGTSHVETLSRLQKQTSALEWQVNDLLDTNSLLYLVNQGLIDFTVADSNQITLMRRFFPKLNVAFDISEPQQLAWALPRSNDTSLYDEVVKFFQHIKNNNTLAQLIDRHYGHARSLNYVGLCKFREHLQNRLPEYLHLFKQAAKTHNFDWRLLAAIGYQESHWIEDATSPTGVRGIMMLTLGTARQLGVKDRTNPAQSIAGGARYFQQRIAKVPKRIQEPDRTWMALAAYNVGFGHLEDARILTQDRGENPDKWLDVKKSLPLLSKKKWYQQTKHGYARGNEPVQYVENIRSYYDLLIWLTEEDQIKKNTMSANTGEADNKNTALQINAPVL